jgi:hypothetical protein
MLDDRNANHNPWTILQQPPHASSGISAAFRILLAAVDHGWLVEEPVTVLPTNRGDTWIYCFQLRHPALEQRQRLFTPATPELERYVERNHYQVIEGSLFDNL